MLVRNPFPHDAFLSGAFRFAAHHHGSQTRKGSGKLYITHPVAVARMLKGAGFGREVVAAGFLHDVLEDTGCELEEIERHFGPQVTKIVVEITDKDKTVRWKRRKAGYLAGLRRASREALAVACADKTDNLLSLVDGCQKNQKKFAALFSGKMKDKLKNYENIRRVVKVRYASCPLLPAYGDALAQVKKLTA